MASQDLSGYTLGNYRLIKLLGEGGMGSVYLAQQLTLGREVAVKVLPSSLSRRPDFVMRFRREAETVAKLDAHPNIVSILDFATTADGISYVVMRLLTGGSLSDRLRGGEHYALEHISELLYRLAGALDFAHKQGIIHRDIKPDNIMFDEFDTPYIVDFGIAKIVTGEVTALTQQGAAVGTPAYMAPEQWKAKPVEPATDQYSMAIVVYYLLTHQLPFVAETPQGLMYLHIEEAPPPPSTHRRDIPTAVSDVLLRALAKDPRQRYPTVTAFAQAFDQAVRAGSKRMSQSQPIRTRPERQRRRFPVASISLIVLLAIAALVLALALITGGGGGEDEGDQSAGVINNTPSSTSDGQAVAQEPSATPDPPTATHTLTPSPSDSPTDRPTDTSEPPSHTPALPTEEPSQTPVPPTTEAPPPTTEEPLPVVQASEPPASETPAPPTATATLTETATPTLTLTPYPESLQVISPSNGAVLVGTIAVFGSASHPNFSSYQIDYGPYPNPSNLWYPIGSRNLDPVFGMEVLGVWDTSTVSDGSYVLRVMVNLVDGSSLEPLIITDLRVDNVVEPSLTPTPPPPSPTTTAYPEIEYFTADHDTVRVGETFTLYWKANTADTFRIDQLDTVGAVLQTWRVGSDGFMSFTPTDEMGDTLQFVFVALLGDQAVQASVVIPILDGSTSDSLPPSTTPTATDPCIYVVQAGDTLFVIAERLGVTIDDLMTANPTMNPDFIEIGQALNTCAAATLAPTEVVTLVPSLGPTPGQFIPPSDTPAPTAIALAANVELVEISNAGDLDNEFIVIRNNGAETLTLDGWILSDADGDLLFTLPDIRLFSSAAIQVYSRAGQNTLVALYANATAAVWQDGDTATLTSPAGDSVTLAVVVSGATPEPALAVELPTDPLELAVFGVTRNDDWEPYIQLFGTSTQMALVPAGCFTMGNSTEGPAHLQCFDEPFWIDVVEISTSIYQRCVDSGACTAAVWFDPPATSGNTPVLYLKWFQAEAFCEWRGSRLVSEREWEYAARGPDGLLFPWGNDYDTLNAVHGGNSSTTVVVGSETADVSWVGVKHLFGNVAEWTISKQRSYPYDPTDGRENTADDGTVRVVRGGSYALPESEASIFSRRGSPANNTHDNVGFRCMRPFDMSSVSGIERRTDDLGGDTTSAVLPTETPTAEATIEATEAATEEPISATPVPTAVALELPPDSPLALAYASVSANADWIPYTEDFDGVTMALVPTGCFIMGSDELENATPTHRQCIDTPFWIDVYEASNDQWLMSGLSSTYPTGSPSGSSYPRTSIRWIEARDFCEQRGARLPTEIEWEYAARGPDGWVYPWGDEFIYFDYAVYAGNAETLEPVDIYPLGASWVGALNMAGNATEWTGSLIRDFPLDATPSLFDPSNENQRWVTRGGTGSLGLPSQLSSFRRSSLGTYGHNLVVGFRCARDIDVSTEDLGGDTTSAVLPTATPTAEATIEATVAPTEEPTSATPAPTAVAEVTLPTDPLELAVFGVTSNDDWEPYTQLFGSSTQMALVPAGCFTMGSTGGQPDASPTHVQCFDEPFWIDVYEVTFGAYDRCVAAGVCGEPWARPSWASSTMPAIHTSWIQSQAFCNWRSAHLPTEREWEYAARGPSNLRYTWGNSPDTDSVTHAQNAIVPLVGGSKANDLSWVGVYDLMGNVAELTLSKYLPYPYDPTDGREDVVDDGTWRVMRGGGFAQDSVFVNTTRRNSQFATNSTEYGFRCARSFDMSSVTGIERRTDDLGGDETSAVLPPETPTAVAEVTLPTDPLELAVFGVVSNDEWMPLTTSMGVTDMALVPAGCYTMGQEGDDRGTLFDSSPPTYQCFDEPFWLDVYEVTYGSYDACVSAGACSTPTGRADWASASRPASFINWYQAREFCTWRKARLPTEREWEYAARGPDDLLYPWGNEWVADNAVHGGNALVPFAVGQEDGDVSWVGVHDLTGNINEWTSSVSVPYPYDPTDGREDPDSVAPRTTRGGSYGEPASRASVITRANLAITVGSNLVGFRCAFDFDRAMVRGIERRTDDLSPQ